MEEQCDKDDEKICPTGIATRLSLGSAGVTFDVSSCVHQYPITGVRLLDYHHTPQIICYIVVLKVLKLKG